MSSRRRGDTRDPKGYYEMLEVPPDASEAQIKKAYKKLGTYLPTHLLSQHIMYIFKLHLLLTGKRNYLISYVHNLYLFICDLFRFFFFSILIHFLP